MAPDRPPRIRARADCFRPSYNIPGHNREPSDTKDFREPPSHKNVDMPRTTERILAARNDTSQNPSVNLPDSSNNTRPAFDNRENPRAPSRDQKFRSNMPPPNSPLSERRRGKPNRGAKTDRPRTKPRRHGRKEDGSTPKDATTRKAMTAQELNDELDEYHGRTETPEHNDTPSRPVPIHVTPQVKPTLDNTQGLNTFIHASFSDVHDELHTTGPAQLAVIFPDTTPSFPPQNDDNVGTISNSMRSMSIDTTVAIHANVISQLSLKIDGDAFVDNLPDPELEWGTRHRRTDSEIDRDLENHELIPNMDQPYGLEEVDIETARLYEENKEREELEQLRDETDQLPILHAASHMERELEGSTLAGSLSYDNDDDIETMTQQDEPESHVKTTNKAQRRDTPSPDRRPTKKHKIGHTVSQEDYCGVTPARKGSGIFDDPENYARDRNLRSRRKSTPNTSYKPDIPKKEIKDYSLEKLDVYEYPVYVWQLKAKGSLSEIETLVDLRKEILKFHGKCHKCEQKLENPVVCCEENSCAVEVHSTCAGLESHLSEEELNLLDPWFCSDKCRSAPVPPQGLRTKTSSPRNRNTPEKTANDNSSPLPNSICTLCKRLIPKNDDHTVSCEVCQIRAHANCANIDVVTSEELKGKKWHCANCDPDTPFSELSENDTPYDEESADEMEDIIASSPPSRITSSTFDHLFEEAEDEAFVEEIDPTSPNHSRIYTSRASQNQQRFRIESSPVQAAIGEEFTRGRVGSKRLKSSTTPRPTMVAKSSTSTQPAVGTSLPAQPAANVQPAAQQVLADALPLPTAPLSPASILLDPTATQFLAETPLILDSMENFRDGVSRALRDQRGKLQVAMNVASRQRGHELTADEINRAHDDWDEATEKMNNILDGFVNGLKDERFMK